MRKRTIDLKFPVGGVHKRAGYQSQPPYTTPDALNVRPFDTLTQRLRGGTRPGVGKSFYTQLGSGNPIRMLQPVTIVERNGLTYWVDNFDAPGMQAWWSSVSSLQIFNEAASISYSNSGSVIRKALSDLDTAQPYVVEMFVVPYLGQHWGNYKIYARMDNSAPAATTAGIIAEIVMPGDNSITGSLKYYTGGVLTSSWIFTSSLTQGQQPGWFRVLINGNDVTCYWRDNVLLTATTVGAAAGSRVGFAAEATQAGGICLVDAFRVQYKTSNNNQAYRELLCASSNGTLYKEDYLNTFTSVSSSLSLASDRDIQATERFQKLYIADTGHLKAVGTNGVVTAGVLDSASYASWNAISASTNDDVVEIADVVGASGGFRAGLYKIGSVHDTNGLTLTDGSGGAIAGSCTTCTFRVLRGPKVYDPAANTLSLLVTTSLNNGSVPAGCPLCCTYRDRIVLAAPPWAPHGWFMSKAGDPLNWDYGASPGDARRAVAGTNTESGLLGEPITALIPGGDDWLVFGMTNSMAKLTGDPAYGGQIQYLSRNVGVVDKQAWCRGPSHEIIVLSRDGLYIMPAGGGVPQSLSRERLPDDLMRLDSRVYAVQLQYDVAFRGVHIFVTARDSNFSGTASVTEAEMLHWWFDWETKSFWPFNLPSGYEPMVSIYHAASTAFDSAVLLGSRDGYVRRFYNSQTKDELLGLQARITYGPISLAGPGGEGRIDELVGTMARYSGDALWALYTAETAEDCLSDAEVTSSATGTWSNDGLNYKARPRLRGAAARLKVYSVSNDEDQAWALENITVVVEPLGRQRKP